MAYTPERGDQYRYIVGEHSSELTPLASVELFLGNKSLSVLNISQGGMAFQIPDELREQLDPGDPVDVSVAIRERAFPMQLEIKHINSAGRASCSFLNPPPAFLSSLREFLGPKYLGASIKHAPRQSNMQEALELTEGAVAYEAFTGTNQTGVFVWMGEDKVILKMLAVSRDLVLCWTPEQGLQTGTVNPQSSKQTHDITWDRVMEYTVYNYLADILLAWASEAGGREWLEQIFASSPGSETSIRFPFQN